MLLADWLQICVAIALALLLHVLMYIRGIGLVIAALSIELYRSDIIKLRCILRTQAAERRTFLVLPQATKKANYSCLQQSNAIEEFCWRQQRQQVQLHVFVAFLLHNSVELHLKHFVDFPMKDLMRDEWCRI